MATSAGNAWGGTALRAIQQGTAGEQGGMCSGHMCRQGQLMLPSKPGLGARKIVWGMATPKVSSCWNAGSPLSDHLSPLMELPETPTVPTLLAKGAGVCVAPRSPVSDSRGHHFQ